MPLLHLQTASHKSQMHPKAERFQFQSLSSVLSCSSSAPMLLPRCVGWIDAKYPKGSEFRTHVVTSVVSAPPRTFRWRPSMRPALSMTKRTPRHLKKTANAWTLTNVKSCNIDIIRVS